MAYFDGDEILDKAFPLNIRSMYTAAVNIAYTLVDATFNNNGYLNWIVGYDDIANLRNVAVEFELKQLLTKSNIKLKYDVVKNKRNNCNHIEITSGNCIMTVSHLHDRYAVPREAKFRNSLSLNNQIKFWGNIPDIDVDEQYYAILTHGNKRTLIGQKVEFICLGLPSPEVNKWETIHDITRQSTLSVVPEEKITEELPIEFIEYIKEREATQK